MIINVPKQISKNDILLHLFDEYFIDDLTKLASDPRIWKYVPEAFYEPQIFREKWINKAIQQTQNNQRICFAIFLDKQIVGSSSYYQIDPENKKLSIGYTWFHPNFWGSIVNPLTKLIMLEYAFENLGYNRVEFFIDAINLFSRQSLTKFGIKQEGILRNHLILADGRIRDSAIYSVISQEWPDIKKNIERTITLE